MNKQQKLFTFTHLAEFIKYHAENNPNKEVLIDFDNEGKRIKETTYQDLFAKMNQIAVWLFKYGLRKGDTVAIAMRNSSDILLLSWSAWAAGFITVPLDVKRDTLGQHLYKVSLTKAKLLLTEKDFFTKEEKKALSRECRVYEADHFSERSDIVFSSWEQDITHQSLVLFTSGTTAHPKGVQLSLKNLIVNASGIVDWFQIKPEDRFLVTLPLHHINSTTFTLATLIAGGSIAIIPQYSNSRFWQQVVTTHSTFTSIVQSVAFDQLSQKESFKKYKKDIKLNRIQIGSAPVVVKDAKEFVDNFQIPLFQGYGQTETALRVTGVPLTVDKSLYGELLERNSIGTALAWADLEIMVEDGTFAKENVDGELVVKGDAVMKGYIGGEEAFRNGYFLTGDIGYFEIREGKKYFFLKGRKKEIIIKGGVNISPVAVENQLKEMSNEIDQVYVIGIPSERYGEEVGAVVCFKEGIDTKRALMTLQLQLLFPEKRHLSQFETPAYLTTINPKDLPITSTGKIQRAILKKRLTKDAFVAIHHVADIAKRQFLFLTDGSKYFSEAYALFNHAWQPLTLEKEAFKKFVRRIPMLLSAENDVVVGSISAMFSDISEEALKKLTYAALVAKDGKGEHTAIQNILCVSITSQNYKPQAYTKIHTPPSEEVVREYLLSKKDGVYNFHQIAKGGFEKGAVLVALMPNARPEDERSVGYNMLMKYPFITQDVVTHETASVSQQLIEVVMKIAESRKIKNIYAFSRPGGLAHFLSQKT